MSFRPCRGHTQLGHEGGFRHCSTPPGEARRERSGRASPHLLRSNNSVHPPVRHPPAARIAPMEPLKVPPPPGAPGGSGGLTQGPASQDWTSPPNFFLRSRWRQRHAGAGPPDASRRAKRKCSKSALLGRFETFGTGSRHSGAAQNTTLNCPGPTASLAGALLDQPAREEGKGRI